VSTYYIYINQQQHDPSSQVCKLQQSTATSRPLLSSLQHLQTAACWCGLMHSCKHTSIAMYLDTLISNSHQPEINLEKLASYSQQDLPMDTCQPVREPRHGRLAVSLMRQQRPAPECSSLPGSVCQSVAVAPAGVREDAGTYTVDSCADTCPAISKATLWSLCQKFSVYRKGMFRNNKAIKLITKADQCQILKNHNSNKCDPISLMWFVVKRTNLTNFLIF